MKTQIIQHESDPAAGAAPPPGGAEQRDGPRVGRVVLGAIAALLALALLAGGVALLYANGKRDDAGYFTTGAHRLSTPANAFESEQLDIDADVPGWVGSSFATTRVQASSTRPVFVGIGPSAAVERYLANVRHAVVTDVDTDPFRVTSHLVPGAGRVAPPAAQGFWRVRSSGAGTRTVTWPVESGRWSFVVMNADGSPAVDVRVRLGVRGPSVAGIAIGLLVAAAVFALIAALLLRSGLRRPGGPARRIVVGSAASLMLVAVLSVVFAAGAHAAPKLTPLGVDTFKPPIPVPGTDGRRHLAYELTLENNAQAPVEVQSVTVRANGHRLLSIPQAQLGDVMKNFAKDSTTTLGPAEGGHIWLDVPLRRGARVPRRLVHHIVARATTPDGATHTWSFDAAPTRVRRQAPEVLGPPLRGGLYMDFNGCCTLSPHRRALTSVDGRIYLSERFAADLIQIDEHGVGGAGDFSRNESLFTYGEPVLAVANATVVDALNTVHDNVPFFEPPSSAFTKRTIMGNFITLRLRSGRYVTYCHLKPGSVHVRRGQRVRLGQVIAHVGNTGQSGGAHLHIQVTDRRDPIASEGLPFVFRSFRLVGRVPNIDEFLTGQAPADIHRDGRTGPQHREMPLHGSVVRFAG